MRFTLPWLREHLETEADIQTIGETLTRLGLEVDTIEQRGGDLTGFSVGEVIEAGPHPSADRLKVCRVQTSQGEVELVCGAPNARTGMKGIFAPVGAVIPDSGTVLKRAVIRGVASNGMLCSERELCLGDDHDGIIELDPDLPVGMPASEALRVEGPVIDVDLTPDRADCFGVGGIARDLAAAGLGALRHRDFSPVPAVNDARIDISLDFPKADACPLFVGRVISGVRNGPSPAWLRERLLAIGLRPISALVDITNLVTVDLGRPLHVFDAGLVRGGLSLRLSRKGESLIALDGRTYELDDGMTVICDDTGVVSLAGIMGGESTGCTDATTDVILEVALFDPVRTGATGRALGIESDARTRFERGVDPELVIPGAEHATRLVLELCGGEPGPLVVAGTVPGRRPPFRFRPDQLARLAGIKLEDAEMERILGALGFGLARDNGAWEVTIPSWRHDVEGEACIVEELARLHGYDCIPPVPVRRTEAVARPILTPDQGRRTNVRRTLAARGLNEAVTWSFIDSDHGTAFGGGVPLRNPISSELSVMRPNVLPGLLAAASRNAARGQEDAGLFEVGPIFTGTRPGDQETVAAGMRAGSADGRTWSAPLRAVDAVDAKADALAALAAAGVKVEALTVARDAAPHYHPGRSGRLMLGPKTAMAAFGELHPRIAAMFEIDAPVVCFEVFLDRLPQRRAKPGRTRPPLKASPFPPVDRDFAFIVDEDIDADIVLRAAEKADKALVRDVTLFDVYRGAGVPEGRKSLALAVRLQAFDRTLTEREIESVAARIVAAAEKAAGAELRA